MDKAIEGATPAIRPDARSASSGVTSQRTLVSGLVLALLLGGILLVGIYFRSVGRNWDEGQNLHPDERFLVMVTNAVQPVRSVSEYFDTAKSPLNPFNKGFGSFAYGTLPLFITRYVAEWCKECGWLQSLLGVKGPLTGYGETTQLGRFLSSIFDLGAMIVLFFMARRLYNTRVAVAATALGAFSVLNIQQSHYYTADTFASFFAILCILFCVRVIQGGGWKDFVGVGLFFGAAIGSRINLLTLAGVIVITLVVRFIDAWRGMQTLTPTLSQQERVNRPSLESVWLGAVLMLLVTLVTFRVVMPYAFAAPDASPTSWLKFNPQWQADTANSARMNRGDVDLPFGHQWTDRWPIWFPFYNMVWFGLGIPLGIAAWTAWGVALWQMLGSLWPRRGESWNLDRLLDNPLLRSHIIPVAWIGIVFFFHGTQWVKSVRYFLQMYPFMALMAGWLVVYAWDKAMAAAEARGAPRAFTVDKGVAAVFGALVLVGTFLFALAFTTIYTKPVTRVAASRWIYENVPTAATVRLDTDRGPRQVQATVPKGFSWAQNNATNVTGFKAPSDGTLSGITLNYLSDPARDSNAEMLEVMVARDPGGQNVLARGQVAANLEQGGPRGMSVEAALDPSAVGVVQEGQEYFLITRATGGTPIQSGTSNLANEHWDDGIPLRLDGRDGFGIYNGLEMTNYDEDNPAKLDKLVNTMEQADYIFMTSGRLYESIPRLPMRWPMTTRYYELMLNRPEELGYIRAAEFTSYAQLGPFVWNDDSSEEQFRVYDHPKVLIFQKTAAFDKNAVKARLSDGIEWNKIQQLWDKEATNVYNNARWRRIPVIGGLIADRIAPLPDKTRAQAAPTPGSANAPRPTLMIPESDWNLQRLGGTWSAIFDPNAPLNTSGFLAGVAWFLAIQVLGLAAFPIAFSVFHTLGDRGWFSSKTMGLLLVSYGAWLIASVQRIVPFGRGLVWLMVLALLVVGGLFAWRQWSGIRAFLRERRRDIIVGEAVFLVLFIGFLLVRMGNPDLWHPYMGGEKPMDFAYMNAVIRAEFFPNYDPWFAGGQMNYYYYGFVMVATMVLMTGIIPAIAYNLTIPLFFALTGLGAFAVVYNLVDKRREGHWKTGKQGDADTGQAEETLFVSKPAVFGTLGALFVAVVGNLGEAQLILRGLGEISGGGGIQSNIPGLSAVFNTVTGLQKLFSGARFNFRQEWWYWNPSRAIPHSPNEAVPITEFPYFTFLYGDLHAHMLTLPLTLLALVLALNIVFRNRNAWSFGTAGVGWPTVIFSWFLLGLTVGSLRPANTWDYPTYMAITVGAFAVHAYRSHGLTGRGVAEALWRSGLLFLVSTLTWLPYINSFATGFNTIEPWEGSRTVWWSYLVVHGFFLFSLVTFVAFQIRHWLASQDTDARRAMAQRFVLQVLGILAVALVGLAIGNYGAWVIGLPIVVAAGLLLLRRPQTDDPPSGTSRSRGGPQTATASSAPTWAISTPTPATTFILLILAAAVSLTLMVDVIVLKGDISRMNTVFKFYLQVWVLLGVGAAAALAWVWDELQTTNLSFKTGWQTAFAVLFFAVSLYPIFATWGRVNDRFDKTVGATLDGMAFMDVAKYSDAPDGRPPVNYELKWDREAIEWMQMNIMGTPVILEAHTVEYRWGSRVSIYTGFPTVVGWSNHQRQQRSALTEPVVDARGTDVRNLFNTTDTNQARQLLQKYNVGYIYVGPTEKAYYQPQGLAKFEAMAQQGQLEKVYTNQEVTIYRVLGGASS